MPSSVLYQQVDSAFDTSWATTAGMLVAILSLVFLLKVPAPGSIVTGLLAAFQRPFKAWIYLFRGPIVIQREFDRSKGQPFEILAPDSRYVFVSSREHINEVDSAPDTVLSLQAASKQMLQPVYTMHGFNWFDRRGTEGVGFVRALRTLLTNHVPDILPDLGRIIRARFTELQEEQSGRGGSLAVYPAIVKIIVLSNAVAFFGTDLAKNERFMVSALSYIEETLLCAETVKLAPKFAAPVIGRFAALFLTSHAQVFSTLMEVAEQRCRERDAKNLGLDTPKHNDCIQWIMETSPRQKPWSAKRIVHEIMAIWFGSVHALSTTITFAIHDICLHPEYVEPLRREAQAQYGDFERTGRGLPLLDSFIKESARLTPVESMSTRRYATQPFALSDGTQLAVGDWACTPVRAIMQDPAHYPAAMEFNGFRFASPADLDSGDEVSRFRFPQPKPSKLTDAGPEWHVWGTGRMVCPGRYYASAVMKVVLSQIIMEYDVTLRDPSASRWFTWRSSMLPKKGTIVDFRRRPAAI
ncbi:cytochrome P450 [Xylariaceae sp. FL0016]|nr:cytochrome P450 [Xylariaceae sp. FL0016]